MAVPRAAASPVVEEAGGNRDAAKVRPGVGVGIAAVAVAEARAPL